MSGGRQPAYALVAHAGGRWSTTTTAGSSCRWTSPTGSRSSRSSGRGRRRHGPLRRSTAPRRRKCFVCICEDVTDKDVKRAIAEGFDSIELAKRYDRDDGAVPGSSATSPPSGSTRARTDRRGDHRHDHRAPPWQPVELGLLAGARTGPRSGSIHHRHKELGATMMWTGPGVVPTPTATRRRGQERPRRARRHRRLHARQAARHRPGRRGVLRAAVPEPLRRHEAGPHPLRRPQLGRGADHGRRHDRPPLGRTSM